MDWGTPNGEDVLTISSTKMQHQYKETEIEKSLDEHHQISTIKQEPLVHTMQKTKHKRLTL